jgi:hypothetical protein
VRSRPATFSTRPALAEQAADPLGADLAAVVLGVDDGDPTGTNGDVVNLCGPVAGQPAVMQEIHPGVGDQLRKALPGPLLPIGAGHPCAGALRLVDYASKDYARPPELGRAPGPPAHRGVASYSR